MQAAFRDCHGLQCGFCTPGFVVSVTAFLRDNPDPTDDEIREALSGNLCRCTGYQGIVQRGAPGGAPAIATASRDDRHRPPAAPRGTSAPASTASRTPGCSPGRGTYVDDIVAARDAARVLRAQPLRPGRDPRHRHLGGAGAPGRALRVHRRRPEPGRQGAVAHVDRPGEPRDAAPAARRGRGRASSATRSRSSSPTAATSPRTRPSWSRSTTSRCPAVVDYADGRATPTRSSTRATAPTSSARSTACPRRRSTTCSRRPPTS